jgi:hypothetical protein
MALDETALDKKALYQQKTMAQLCLVKVGLIKYLIFPSYQAKNFFSPQLQQWSEEHICHLSETHWLKTIRKGKRGDNIFLAIHTARMARGV